MDANSTGLGVVVGADGSAPSRVAVDWAARAAQARSCRLTIAHAISMRMTWATNRLMVYGHRDMPHMRTRRTFDDAVRIAEASTGPSGAVDIGIKPTFNDPVEALAKMSRDAALMVVGASRGPAWSALLRGTVRKPLVSLSQCPLATIREVDLQMPHPAHSPVSVSVSGWSNTG